MTAPFRQLRDVTLADAGEVGAKAASLGALAKAGERVPAGVVLTVAGAAMDAAERARALADAIRDIGPGPYAVRSSAAYEDSANRSFAGQLETVLAVDADDVPDAVERCLASAGSVRVAAYSGDGAGPVAVIVQRMVEPTAAGVAFTADPVSGDRRTTVITAVRGLADRLVAGEAIGDEWRVRGRAAAARRQPERAITRRQAREIARAARRIADARDAPQDVEWAIDRSGTLWILQARPMTALPPEVSWEPPLRGAFTRAFRFGEWIPEPVTPLFESWLLTMMEERLHELHAAWVGQVAPRPYHVVLNGWYFYSLGFLPLPGASLFRSLPRLLRIAMRTPRRVAVMFFPTARHAVPLYEREWREEIQPRYRAAVQRTDAMVGTAPVAALPAMIDELASAAGEYFASLAVVGGSGYKVEASLGEFYRRVLAPRIGGSPLSLLGGILPPPAETAAHTVESLDWWRPPRPAAASRPNAVVDHDRIVAARRAAEEAAFAALADSPRRLRAFRRLLADAQHLVPLREEQVRELTLPWPTLRRAVLRIGQSLAEAGVIDDADDAFFLTRAEVLASLGGAASPLAGEVKRRRADREVALRLVPPLFVGRVPRMVRMAFRMTATTHGAAPSDRALVSGAPASAGRATGRVRVIRRSDEFDELEAGEILVAPLTTPAWTPLFGRAAAVVTDVGSALSHASIVAREYGIPAVVGCEDATARLATGTCVTVDGGRGTVEPATVPPKEPAAGTDRPAP